MKSEASADKRRICRPGEESDNIKVDAEFANLIPPLSTTELEDLHQSLDAEGCRDTLIVWKDHNKLVDGHNRLKYCRDKGLPFPVVEREFADKDEVKGFIISQQLGRRNLSPAAESYLRGKRFNEKKKQGARTDLTSGQSGQKSTAEELAEKHKVGARTIRRDGKFAEAVDRIIENCGADAKNLILSRETGLTRGGVMRLARLKPEEQEKYLKELKESGKRPRKANKAKSREPLTIPTRPRSLVQAILKQLSPEDVAEVARALSEAVATQGQGEERERKPRTTNKRKAKAK